MDFLGTLLMMGASITLLLALQYGGVKYAWKSSVVIGLLVGSVLMVIALAIVEIWLGELAMLTPRIMTQRSVWVNGVWGFFFAGSISLRSITCRSISKASTTPVQSAQECATFLSSSCSALPLLLRVEVSCRC